ncbi:putative flagellar basal-body rod protein FlgC [Parvularcula bermudensis HTCC2503]|uniref:Putative flagellar basal-body rod protein FlgC n=1 Tax=Parvularcula bermudensis (strain ATCC BAA-594 / HTCC2503 / KCTC 12087) TaxID=314260 RepID=E0TH62_PARBH|nr:flagellar basal body rod C-terminal domain-containing protein [Parvularcula bermudensis]ADM09646.1 putative flagellar basal-body rod protein FlgC [Parvularcula bermudensis HTCC2503]
MADPLLTSLRIAGDGMNAQSFRMRTVNENLSNIDTPGYQRKMLTFSTGNEQAVRVSRMILSSDEARKVHDPGHPLADADGFVEMSNVDMLTELSDAREAKRSFDANIEAFRQAREMYAGLISLMRRS